MKLNWGQGITIALALFMTFIAVLAINLMMHSADLETEDYYQKEIAYETEIVSLKNAQELSEKPSISLTDTHILVQFPNEGDFLNSVIKLNRPNDKDQDVLYQIKDTRTYTIDKSSLNTGIYNVVLSYTINGKNCLQKEQLYI